MYTDELIAQLIACPKQITDSPKEGKESRNSASKIVFGMRSMDGVNEFSGFITQNSFFAENFSVGLIHVTKTDFGKIVLCRCNGSHGGHVSIPHHFGCHIHISTAERILAGKRPEGQIEMANEYVTLEEAIQFYVNKINIIPRDKAKHFPPPNIQTDLFGQVITL